MGGCALKIRRILNNSSVATYVFHDDAASTIASVATPPVGSQLTDRSFVSPKS
ncbi:MAG: hypothetical protein ACXU9S_16370 [Gemmatimonadaceae bacterium]